jgi:hypothetical protein
MEHTFDYAILKAIPDARRGERVNVGIIVFLPDRIDVRLSDLAKLRAISRSDWAQYATDFRARIMADFKAGEPPKNFLGRLSLMESVIRFSDVAWFSIEAIEQYDDRIKEILDALVIRPRSEPKPKSTRINTEIARTFRTSRILARPTENIDDHKVVPNFYISKEEELRADFVLKNGVYHVTATLDLRRSNVDISQAALKAIVLDKAGDIFPSGVRRLGVYAAPPGSRQFQPHIDLLTDYADDAFNWLDKQDRERYTRSIYAAWNAGNPLKLTPQI